ncbi:MAG: N-acetyl-gamma-glutamyl-phosphate reductase [Pseudomonadales bacterium]|nr:N-acetyl-gamma-glutamyl-phosphate reductase [Pseudomonadales bacterium]
MIKVGVVGGTGYTGVELLRLIAGHPQAELSLITSRSEEGKAVADMYPNLRGAVDIRFSLPDNDGLGDCDLVFFATPNAVAMHQVPDLLKQGVRIVDLSADFRLRDNKEWSRWYGAVHACPEILEQAVYGLPEVNRAAIKEARIVANPGCYPTAVQLGFLPLLKQNLVNTSSLIADAKSGVSGAGRGASIGSLLCEASESFKAYAVSGHRHLPEIKQGLVQAASMDVELTFVPHLTPMIRGIHATLYADLTVGQVDLQSLYEEAYATEPFVDILPQGSHPETRSVKGSNYCRIAVHQPQEGNRVVVLSVIDNLVKGAAGQAVQNMNIMFGLPESMGLEAIALMP